jgi:hypothetical protein
MGEVTSSAARSLALADQEELRVAVAELFCVFKRKYGHRWNAQFEDPQARPVWFASLRAAGVTADAVKRGLAMLSKVGTGWPPSDEEFIRLCSPDAPSLEQALAEALNWARDTSGTFEFSHPAIGAAARSVTAWALRSESAARLRQLFDTAYRTALNLYAKGADLSAPLPKALPKEVRTTIPPGAADPPSVATARAKAARLLGLAS